MSKSITSVALVSILALSLLSGCNKNADTSPKVETPTAPTVPDKPATPDAVTSTEEQAKPALPAASTDTAVPEPAASASVGANGVEASAGDVSVKLPN